MSDSLSNQSAEPDERKDGPCLPDLDLRKYAPIAVVLSMETGGDVVHISRVGEYTLHDRLSLPKLV